MALPESPPRASGRRAFAERQGRDKGFRAVRDNPNRHPGGEPGGWIVSAVVDMASAPA